MKRVSVDKILTQRQLDASAYPRDLLLYEFVAAYEALRRAASNGDLTIHLSIEVKE